jgi:Tol biopolymer transport system component
MKQSFIKFLSFRIGFIFFSGLLVILFSGIFITNQSAQNKSDSESNERNLVPNRLAFSSRSFGGFPDAFIITSNPDGAGRFTLPTTFRINPDWSPDATKIVCQGTQSPQDIYVVNADGSGEVNLTNTAGPIQETDPSWSITGKIAYIKNNQVWTMNADGSGQTQFSSITQPNPSSPDWSPDGTQLAFASNGEIWVINTDGTNQRRITTNSSFDDEPAWSPDGGKIIFSRDGIGLSVINADGTNELPVTNTSGDKQPAWSPDGTLIAFRRTADFVSGMYIMNANGTNQVRIVADIINFPLCCDIIFENPVWQPVAQVNNAYTISGRITGSNVGVSNVTVNLSGTTNASTTTDSVGNYQFSGLPIGGNYLITPSLAGHAFSPAVRSFNNLTSNQIANFEDLGICQNGRCVANGKIAFTRGNDIFTMNSDGLNQVNLTNNATFDTEPTYSPDGSKIVFSTNRDGNYEIYRMNADGSNPVRLTNNSASDVYPNYSPDGSTIIFISNRDGNNEIYKMNADGTNQVRLTNDAVSQAMSEFSPDGQKIIFVVAPSASAAPNQLWVMNADGTNQQQFPNPAGPTHFYNHPTYSPNGQKIIFTYGTDVTAQQVWTMNADGTNRVQSSVGGRSTRYSPDGTKLVFSSPFTPLQGIYTNNINGTSSSSLRLTTQFDELPDWQPIITSIRRTPFDFDADGRSDVSVFRPSDGIWYVLRSQAGFLGVPLGTSGDVIVPADYDGDLKTDVAIWRPSTGDFYIHNSFTNTIRVENFGISGDIPTVGDYDGDNKADLAVYRDGTQGYFYYRASMGNPQGNITFVPWGMTGDKPVASDYDGDGRTDAAVYRPSNGAWYVRKSTDGQLFAAQFGLANDKLVPADYDGDGKTDFAVFRAGIWYVLGSTEGFSAYQWGIATDIPAPADYDADGKADIMVFRNRDWFMYKRQTGWIETTTFGLNGDNPVPAAYVR